MSEFRTGYGADWLDLTASLVGRYAPPQTDQLTDAAAAQRWFAQHGMAPDRPVTDRELATLRDLREALHALAHARVVGAPAPTGAVEVLRATSRRPSTRPLEVTDGRLRVGAPDTGREAITRLAHSAVDDLCSSRAEQLRHCGDDTCSGIFLDPTGRRRWCSDKTCGNRARVRAHRARVRAAH